MVALTRALEAPRLTSHALFPVLVVVYLTLMTLIGTRVVVPLFGWGSGILPAEYDNDAFGARLARWDSGYYLTIANEGYSADGAERAFFPLYPLLVRWLSAFTGISVLWCGKLLSIVCFLCAAWLLHRWLLDEFDSTTASWGMAWFCLFPMSFYLVAFYPEALFLLAAIASIYAARRGRFVAAGMAIAIAGATRPVAFLLAVPYVFEFVLQRDFRRRCLAEFAGGALLAPLGTLCYLAYLSIQAGGGDPVAHYHSNLEAHWRMATTWPWQTLERAFRSALYGEGI
ncbi:MAG TPA: mannosyltransferase family protein, partial [Roseiflexaceae bacterium]|nr:mannosyltransferase family protein [Roseiflexaceae bacterium]